MNETQYLRVTDILNPFTGYSKVNPFVLNNAKIRGDKIHEYAAACINKLGVWDPLPIHQGYVDSFKKFWGIGSDVILVEERLFDDQYHITGCLDLVIRDKDGLTLIDWKTSKEENITWKAQGSAYSWLAKKAGYPIKKIKFIKLQKNGDFPLICEYQEDFNEFLNFYEIYHKCFKGINYESLLD